MEMRSRMMPEEVVRLRRQSGKGQLEFAFSADPLRRLIRKRSEKLEEVVSRLRTADVLRGNYSIGQAQIVLE